MLAATANVGYVPRYAVRATTRAASACKVGTAPMPYGPLCTRATSWLPFTTHGAPQAVTVANKLANWPTATSLDQI